MAAVSDCLVRTAAEVAGRLLLQLLKEACRIGLGDPIGAFLSQDYKDYEGIEWWCRNQCARMGAHFHYDTDIGCGSHESPARPSWSSVLYLGNVGGPTVVLDQASTGRKEMKSDEQSLKTCS